jgi:hypothetical protein
MNFLHTFNEPLTKLSDISNILLISKCLQNSYKKFAKFLLTKFFKISYPNSLKSLTTFLQFFSKFVLKISNYFKNLFKFLLASYDLVMIFLPNSYKILWYFVQNPYFLLMILRRSSDKLLTNFLQTSYKLLTNFLQISYKLLITSYKLLTGSSTPFNSHSKSCFY